MYYSYHNHIKKLINEGKLLSYQYVKEYHHISPALLLYFKDNLIYPIREQSWFLYYKYLDLFDKQKK